jgi:hypothetical protein
MLKGVSKTPIPSKAVKVHTGKLQLPRGLVDLMPQHIKYLEGRGFNVNKLKKLWDVQAIGMCGELRWRVFIPIKYQGKTVSWTTRSIRADATLRYWSASSDQESVPHKSLLYGEDYCRHSVIVHEGAIDAWSVGPGATATCGIGYSQAQLIKIAKYPRRTICFDNEPAAQKRARELCNILEALPGQTNNVQLDAKDANTASRRELRLLRKHFLD